MYIYIYIHICSLLSLLSFIIVATLSTPSAPQAAKEKAEKERPPPAPRKAGAAESSDFISMIILSVLLLVGLLLIIAYMLLVVFGLTNVYLSLSFVQNTNRKRSQTTMFLSLLENKLMCFFLSTDCSLTVNGCRSPAEFLDPGILAC